MHEMKAAFCSSNSDSTVLVAANNALLKLYVTQANCETRRRAARTLHDKLRYGLMTEADMGHLTVSCEGKLLTSVECILQRLLHHDITELDQNEDIVNSDVLILLELLQGALRGSQNSTVTPSFTTGSSVLVAHTLKGLRSLVLKSKTRILEWEKICSAIGDTLTICESQSSLEWSSSENSNFDSHHIHKNNPNFDAKMHKSFESNNGEFFGMNPPDDLHRTSTAFYKAQDSQILHTHTQYDNKQTSIVPPIYTEGQKPKCIERADPQFEDVLFQIDSLLLSCCQSLRESGGQISQDHICNRSFCSSPEQRKVLEVGIKRAIKATAYLLDYTLPLHSFEIFLHAGYCLILIQFLEILSLASSLCVFANENLDQVGELKLHQIELGMLENLVVHILLFLQALSNKNNLRFRSLDDFQQQGRIYDSTIKCGSGQGARSQSLPMNGSIFSYGGASLAIVRVALPLVNARNAQIRYLATIVCFISLPTLFEPNLNSKLEIVRDLDAITADRLSLVLASLNYSIKYFHFPLRCIPALFGKYLHNLRPYFVVEASDSFNAEGAKSEWLLTKSRSRLDSLQPKIFLSRNLLDLFEFADEHLNGDTEHGKKFCEEVVSARSTKDMSNALFRIMIEILLFPQVQNSLLENRGEWMSSIERILSIPPSSSKDYELLSVTLSFLSTNDGVVKEKKLVSSIIPCSGLIFNQRSLVDRSDRLISRSIHNAQYSMMCLLHGFFTILISNPDGTKHEYLEHLRSQRVGKDDMVSALIELCIAPPNGQDSLHWTTPRLHFGALSLMKQLLQLDCLCSNNISRLFDSLALCITSFQKSAREGFSSLDPLAYNFVLLMRIASSMLRSKMVEIALLVDNIEVTWLILLMQDIAPIVKAQGFGIMDDLVCRGLVSNNSETSPIALQMIDLTLKVARNKEENHAVHDASISLLSSLINAGVFVEDDDLFSLIACCQMRWEQMKAAHKNLLEDKTFSVVGVTENFGSSPTMLTLVCFLRSIAKHAIRKHSEPQPSNILRHLHSNGILLQTCTLLTINPTKLRNNKCDVLDSLDMALEVKAVVFQLFTIIACDSNDEMVLENIIGYDLLRRTLFFFTWRENAEICSRPSYLYCFSSACRCLVPIMHLYSTKMSFSTENVVPESRESMWAVMHNVFCHERALKKIDASKAALTVLQTIERHFPDWLRDLNDENCSDLLGELLLLFHREFAHRSAVELSPGINIIYSCAHTVANVWKLSNDESISEKALALAQQTAAELCAGFLKNTQNLSHPSNNSNSQRMTEHSEQAMGESVVFFNQSDSNATLSSLIILQSLLQFKRVRKDICEQRDLLPKLMTSFFSVILEEYRRVFLAVDVTSPPSTLDVQLLETSLVVVCTLMKNEPDSKLIIAGSPFIRIISDIALEKSCGLPGFSSFTLNLFFAALYLLAKPETSGKAYLTMSPICSKVVVSLKSWIALLRSSNTRKEIVRSTRCQARVVGGLKVLAAITLGVDGRRNALFVWNEVEDLLNLITDVRSSITLFICCICCDFLSFCAKLINVPSLFYFHISVKVS